MNAAELRIGNWVMSKEGIPIQVLCYFDKSARNDIYTTSSTDLKYEEDDCEGILITIAILKQSGFINNPNYEHPFFDKYMLKNDTAFAIGNFNGEHWIVDGVDQWFGHHKIEYVHQLQNLYYALTYRELEINL